MQYGFGVLFETINYLAFFAAVTFSYFYYMKFRNQERMSLIERGVDVSEIYKKPEGKKNFPWITLAFFIMFVGIGIALSIFVSIANDLHKQIGVPLGFAICLISGSIGLLIGRKKEKKEDQ
ncbi:hypothetical protein KMW28_07595 [Flammeovirga yaeyamensis]|uniref:DUF6249 domain-containing protein n=1 Tax=Flammeovirga yaeyamensis TaxID=367791 RepID=A0AAX1N7K2_9BACT|nr:MULTISPECIES: DUF6249 domain-containing protein [Flammeovirga]ANQ49092.2 hypothetical protein MY04_1718 [Flammeovirga sp. MY04]MBB3698045.1 hypothetical protein [Flammeovirga yaeyamensis]NMF35603.1 hypothetical protein [Flammeovirga yaeyamensis]QWG03439.1 hypothetical protein KMW28_07595 [Flammeovirga yaeyamensis]